MRETAGRRGLLVCCLALLVGGAAMMARGEGAGLLEILHPGSFSAAAIGGDPFLSPLADDVGYWSLVPAAERGSIRTAWTIEEPITRRSSNGAAHLFRREILLQETFRGTWGDRPYYLSSLLTFPRSVGDLDLQPARLRSEDSRSQIEMIARFPVWVHGLSVQTSVRPVQEGRVEGRALSGFGLRYQRGRQLALQGSWSRSRTTDPFAFILADAPWTSSMNLQADRTQIDGRLQVLRGLGIEGSWGKNRYERVNPAVAEASYQILPDGFAQMRRLAIVWGRVARPWLLVRWTSGQARLGGSGFWGGERFGKLNYLRASLESFLVAIQTEEEVSGRRWLLDLESVRAEGQGRGEIESWPFTSTWIDLLGSRRIYRGGAAARWLRCHGAIQAPLRRWIRGEVGAAWTEVAPEGDLVSWRPAFLVFGSSDVKRAQLDLRRLALASVSTGLSVDATVCKLSLGIEQVVYARSWKRDQDAGDSPGHAGAVGRKRDTKGWPGGSRVSLHLTREF